jgi:4-hydroxy-tetrahydrodipicolinate reductase
MKIALLGYGKMGKTIEQIAIQRGHQIVLKVDKDDHDYDITKADVAIDFSIPSVAFNNISNCYNICIITLISLYAFTRAFTISNMKI